MQINWQATVVATVASLFTIAWSEPAAKGADPPAPLVQVGLKSDQTPVKLYGGVTQADNGTLNLPGGGPWGWVVVGLNEKPMPQLEGLRPTDDRQLQHDLTINSAIRDSYLFLYRYGEYYG